MALNNNFTVTYKANVEGIEIEERIVIPKLLLKSDNVKFGEMLTNAKPSMETVRPNSPASRSPKRRNSVR